MDIKLLGHKFKYNKIQIYMIKKLKYHKQSIKNNNNDK